MLQFPWEITVYKWGGGECVHKGCVIGCGFHLPTFGICPAQQLSTRLCSPFSQNGTQPLIHILSFSKASKTVYNPHFLFLLLLLLLFPFLFLKYTFAVDE